MGQLRFLDRREGIPLIRKKTKQRSFKDRDVHQPRIPIGERCMNPWNGKKCSSTDIALYIMFKGRRLPICWKCWKDISSKDIEWRYK